MQKIKICQVSTVHRWKDIRIYQKQCKSLAAAGYETHLVINIKEKGAREGMHDGIHVHDLKFKGNRVQRVLSATQQALKIAKEIKADIYHLHDPELLLIARELRKTGAKVIFDSHENVPANILSKDWIPVALVRKITAMLYERYEKKIVGEIDGVISVLEPLTERFVCRNSETIKNYPILKSAYPHKENWEDEKITLIYAGGLSRIRGLKEMIDALQYVKSPVELKLLGPWETAEYERDCMASPGWKKVTFYGMISNDEVYRMLSESHLGIVNFYKEPNHMMAYPNKAFEYMAAGVPLMMSDIPFWQEEFDKMAYFVNPIKPKEIAEKIEEVIKDRAKMRRKGNIGKDEANKNFSWDAEAKKLFAFYHKLHNS